MKRTGARLRGSTSLSLTTRSYRCVDLTATRIIPIFAGDSAEYCNFIRVFKNVENVIETKSTRLYYLKQYRSGHEVKNYYVKGQPFQASSEYIVRCQGGARRYLIRTLAASGVKTTLTRNTLQGTKEPTGCSLSATKSYPATDGVL